MFLLGIRFVTSISSQYIVNFSSNGLKYHLKKRAGHCQETEAEAGGKLSPTEEEGLTSQNQVDTGESGGKLSPTKVEGPTTQVQVKTGESHCKGKTGN